MESNLKTHFSSRFYLLWLELLFSKSISSLLLFRILLVSADFRWLMMVLNEDSNMNPETPDAVQSGSLDILVESLRIFDVTMRDDRRNVNLVSILNAFTNERNLIDLLC